MSDYEADPREWEWDSPGDDSLASDVGGEEDFPAPQVPASDEPQAGGQQFAPFEPQDFSAIPNDSGKDKPAQIAEGFSEKCKEPFLGLLYLGSLSSTFDWLGHRFVIRTLNVDEILAISQLLDSYPEQSLGYQRAYATAMAAICIDSVDGQSLPVPIGPSDDPAKWAREKFNYVRAHWFSPTIDKVYSEYLVLEGKMNEVFSEMEKASDPKA